MQPGTLLSSESMAYTSRILVNGIQRPAVSWSVDRELAGGLPAQVTAVSGITQATGTIEWAGAGFAPNGSLNPWNSSTGWIPGKGDLVEIYAGDTVAEWKQFHGIIDRTSGSIGDGFQSTLIDEYDKLSATLSHRPLLRVMPPVDDGAAWVGVGLTSTYYLDAALRVAGFYTTPPTEATPALHVPAQGSMWTDRGVIGTLRAGAGYDPSFSHARNFAAPWGWSVSNFRNTYSPRIRMTISSPLQVTLLVAPNHAGSFTMDFNFGASRFRMAVWASRNIDVYWGATRVVGLTGAQISSATIITFLKKGNAWTLRADNGASATATLAVTNVSTMGDVAMEATDLARVAGMQISHPTSTAQEFASLTFIPSARLNVGPQGVFGNLIDAGRAMESVQASELVQEIGESTLSAAWIDELGVFNFTPSMVLNSQAPARTVSTLSDITKLDWLDDLLGSRSKVTVKGLVPAISRSKFTNRTLYEGSGATMESREEAVEFIGPAADRDWVMPDETMTRLGTGNWSTYNAKKGTYGGCFFSSSGDTVGDAGLTMDISMETVGINRYKIMHTAGTYPVDVVANLATSPTDSTLWARHRDKPLPRIAGKGEIVWSEVEVTSSLGGGAGPELVHNAGPWNNWVAGNSALEDMASYLAEQTSNPKPVITGLEIAFDPRLQLGDVIRVSSPGLMGVDMTALITQVNNSRAGDGQYSQELSVRILSSTTKFLTFEEFNKSSSGPLSFQQWQAIGTTPQTFSEFNAEQEA